MVVVWFGVLSVVSVLCGLACMRSGVYFDFLECCGIGL